MTCSPYDLRDYVLGELDAAARRAVEAHACACSGCYEEVERLRLTHTALLALRDEEIPQRIAFVSDKVFEPSPWRRVWAGFWGSSARLGFAASAMLLAAALVWTRPVPAPAPAANLAALETRFEERLKRTVAAAVAESEARQRQATAETLAAAEKRYQREQQELLLTVNENLRVMHMRTGSLLLASSGAPPQ